MRHLGLHGPQHALQLLMDPPPDKFRTGNARRPAATPAASVPAHTNKGAPTALRQRRPGSPTHHRPAPPASSAQPRLPGPLLAHPQPYSRPPGAPALQETRSPCSRALRSVKGMHTGAAVTAGATINRQLAEAGAGGAQLAGLALPPRRCTGSSSGRRRQTCTRKVTPVRLLPAGLRLAQLE